MTVRWTGWPQKRPLMGYFGGGWRWVIGVKVGPRTIIVELLIGSLRIERKR